MRQTVFILYLLLTAAFCSAKDVHITVEAGQYDRHDCIVSADVSKLKIKQGEEVVLFEKRGKEKVKVACQLLQREGEEPVLCWVMSGCTKAGAEREYIARTSKKTAAETPMQVDDTGKALVLKRGTQGILQYNYAPSAVPDGVDPVFSRSGYIHPAYSPAGNVLTAIQPKDHRHHYGIWNPWTRIEYDGKMYDLWNLGDRKGTVRSRSVDATYQGDVCAGYAATLDHYIFNDSGERVIMDETWDVKAWNTSDGFLWDFVSVLHPATDLPVLIKEYRYAGFGCRATEDWTRENSIMITSEGKTRQETDGTRARWIYVTGMCAGQSERSGMLFMSHPDNYNSPEPLRIWDENANGGRGDVFVNFAPTKNMDWKLDAGSHYTLRYRVFSYDGEMTKEKAEALWTDFAYPPKTTVR